MQAIVNYQSSNPSAPRKSPSTPGTTMKNWLHENCGHYLLYRHDKDPYNNNQPPFIQACASITYDSPAGLIYKDQWGDNEAYQGFVFFVGSKINIIGES